MEKSIETIWKEGFLRSDALIAPKLNDLYNKKSIDLVDRFKRAYALNQKGIIIGAFFTLVISFLGKLPFMGIGFFMIFMSMVVINKWAERDMNNIDKNQNSYIYINTFNGWLRKRVSIYRRLASYYYPLFFLSAVLGFRFSTHDGINIYEEITKQLVLKYPDIQLFYGVPVIGMLSIVIITILLSYFGGKIYDFDLKTSYGNILKKLEEIIADMEELRL